MSLMLDEGVRVDAVVCDPPYELGFMGKGWDSTGIANRMETWLLAFELLKPGGHLLAFSGTRTQHRMVCAIEDAGFEIRDQIGWLYGTGFPKSRNIGNGWGTALKPAWEPICVARKPLEGTVAANVLEHGTGALNIDACRIPGQWERSSTTRCDIRGGKFVQGGSGALECEPQAAHPAGRWPANVIHDGSEEVLEAFAAFGEKGGGFGVCGKGQTSDGWGLDKRVTGQTIGFGDTGTAARFFYSAKASKADRAGSAHPTVKPISLMRYLCRLVTPPGGLILDPFAGSGTTLEAAALEGFRCIGIEQSAEYVADIRRRLERTRADLGLFAAE